MDKKSNSKLDLLEKAGAFPPKVAKIFANFVECYAHALEADNISFETAASNFRLFFELIQIQLKTPYKFELYHKKVRRPIDYYEFGLNFIRPLVDLPRCKTLGLDIFSQIERQIAKKENAILFANHQMEPDPQAISILLEKTHPELAEKIIYVAGERVITDPLAVPFSLGCDLLCIYSKRYIDHPIEDKAKKQTHNKQTMEQMRRLLEEGGKIIYVAPSGGRDRKNSEGEFFPADFDANSIAMFHLMASKSNRLTHFYPLALNTHKLLPPPETVQIELGEPRVAKRAPIGLAIGESIPIEYDPTLPKEKSRQKISNSFWQKVSSLYKLLQI